MTSGEHHSVPAAGNIRAQSKRYFTELGARISQLRKARGYTQAELARRVGVSQPAMFAYEMGDRRVSVLVLVRLAGAFGMTVDELVALSKPVVVRKRRLSPRAMRHAQRLQALSKTHQRFVVRILDVLEERGGAGEDH